MPQLSFATRFGDLTITEEEGALVSLDWGWARDVEETPLLATARDQVYAWCDGTRRRFDLPLRPQGTAFQQRVWAALLAIPYGETRTYGDLAKDLKTAPRAIGLGCGRNPLPILIPCHRVIASTGGLGGYSGDGGVETKKALLDLERKS